MGGSSSSSSRGRLRRPLVAPTRQQQHVLRRCLASALLSLSLRRWDTVAAGGSHIIALALPEVDLLAIGTRSNESEGYFPLARALTSVLKLAVDDINAAADADSLTAEGNLTLSVVRVKSGTRAIEGLCDALAAVGENGTFGIVGPVLSSQASLLETISNDFFGLPLVTPSASAARAVTYFGAGSEGLGAGPSYLFGAQPDVFQEMKALSRLILDMKTERDIARGWYQTTERVFVIYPDDSYGPIAASAFVRAVRSTIGINVEFNAAGQSPSTIDIAASKPVEPAAGTDYRPTLLSLMEKDASVIVLLAEGYDGVFIRSVLEQAREVGLVNNETQWYLNGAAATDGIFSVNDTYHDSQLAYDLRGTLGVRACPPTKGPGSDEIVKLASRWDSLNSEVYAGAGPGTLTPDGRLDPLLAFAYDSVFALAGGIGAVQSTALEWGSSLRGFVTESCPFRTEGLWEDGEFIRSATLDVDFVGVTGSVNFMAGENLVTNAAGTAGSGWREANGTTFCALNLQAHASRGGTFATTMSWQPEQLSDTNGTAAFETLSPYQNNQTFPAGGVAYPFDRPRMSGKHFKVVTEEASIPFAIITGRETEIGDYEGITMDLLRELSKLLGFSYNISAVNSSVSADEVIAHVADGTFDIAASWTVISARRMEYVSFSYPFYDSGLSFVYRVDVADTVSWWKMFQPFEINLWAAVFVSTALVFLLLWVFDGGKNELFTHADPEASRRRKFVQGLGMTSYVTGALLMGQMAHEPYTLESYILTSGWMFACFILAASFTAELASFLTAAKVASLTFGIDDLKNGAVSHNQVALEQGSTVQSFYEEEIMKCYSEEECFNGGEDTPVPCYTLDDCFALVENGTCKATIVDTVTAEYRVANNHCGLGVLPDTFSAVQYGLVLEKESPYLGELRQAMLLLAESGTITSIAEPYFESSRCAYLDNYDEVSAVSLNLTLVDMGGVFLVLAIFVGISLVSWVFRRSAPAKAFWRRYYARRKERQAAEKMKSIGPHVRKASAESSDDANQTAENVEADLDRDINSWSRRPIAEIPTKTAAAAIRRPSPIPEEPRAAQPFEGGPASPPQHQRADIEPSVSRSDSTVSGIEPSVSRSDSTVSAIEPPASWSGSTVSVDGPSEVSSSGITVSVQAPPDSRSARTVSVHGPPVAGCGCAPFSCVAVGETKESDQHEHES